MIFEVWTSERLFLSFSFSVLGGCDAFSQRPEEGGDLRAGSDPFVVATIVGSWGLQCGERTLRFLTDTRGGRRPEGSLDLITVATMSMHRDTV